VRSLHLFRANTLNTSRHHAGPLQIQSRLWGTFLRKELAIMPHWYIVRAVSSKPLWFYTAHLSRRSGCDVNTFSSTKKLSPAKTSREMTHGICRWLCLGAWLLDTFVQQNLGIFHRDFCFCEISFLLVAVS
jgi:hypothetical protein